jgi:predicted lipid-binding transport protein (Tim44 family)
MAKQKENEPINSVSLSVGVFWILPMLCIAVLTRFAVDTGPSFHQPQASRPVSLNFDGGDQAPPKKASSAKVKSSSDALPDESSSKFLSNKPFSYKEVVKAIARRRLDWQSTSLPPSVKSQDTRPEYQAAKPLQQSTSAGTKEAKKPATPARGASSDPARLELVRQLDQFREEYRVSQYSYGSTDYALLPTM